MEEGTLAREIDDIAKRKKYKQNQYGDRKSRKDDYTGERVFSGNTEKAIKKHPIDKISDTDHVTPIKVVQSRYKGLSDDQQRIIANSEHNYAITNSKLNRSKGGLENHEYLMRQTLKGENPGLKTSAKMLEKEAESRIAMRVQATAMYTENVVHKISDTDFAMKAKGINQAGKEEAVNSAIFASALSVTTNAVSVVKGEKDCKEAVKDTVKDTVTAAAAGYATGALMKQIALEHTEASILVNGSVQIAKQVLSLASGEITTDEFIAKTAETAAYITAGYIGKCVGGAIGEVVTTLICSNLIDTIRFSKEFEKRNSQVIALYKRAEHEIRASQNTLKYIINKENGNLVKNVSDGLQDILDGIKNNSYDSIQGGIISIGNEFGMTENDFKKDLITKDNIFSGSDETIILE